MIIGLGKEIKTDEKRVALLPKHVNRLIDQDDHIVLVENAAGEEAGFSDENYAGIGAKIVDKKELYDKSDLIVKIKCPLENEYKYLKKEQILFTYLHFDENIPAKNIMKIASTGVTGIALEWVEENGERVLLNPMSEISGVLFALRSMELLMKNKGILPGDFFASLPSPNALIIGIGHIGANVLKVFLRNNINLFILDKHPWDLENRVLEYVERELWEENKDKITVIKFNNENPLETLRKLERLMPKLDIVINCAIRRPDLPKSKMEYLITKDMVSKMGRGSIICDATACDKDFIETVISTDKLFETYKTNGVIHYNCDHIPSVVPRTASILLANAIFRYLRILANKGFKMAVSENTALFKAVMCYRGYLTHEYSCRKKNLPHRELHSVLQKS